MVYIRYSVLDTALSNSNQNAVSNLESAAAMPKIKARKKTNPKANTWADRQKEAGVKLELSAYPARNCWKKYYKGKMKYFSYPINKEGYEAALTEWFNYKAELEFEQPYKARIKHYQNTFKPVQKYFDNTLRMTTEEKKLGQQVNHFLGWLETAFTDPELIFPNAKDFESEDNTEKEMEQAFFSNKARKAMKGKKEFLNEFVTLEGDFENRFGSLSYSLPEEWQEKTEFEQSKVKLPQTVGYWAEEFLNRKTKKAKAGVLRVKTVQDANEKLKKFRDFIGDNTPVITFKNKTLDDYYYFLLGEKFNNKQNYFNYARQFIKWCWKIEECIFKELPTMIDDRTEYKFPSATGDKNKSTKAKNKMLWTKEEVHRVIAKDSKLPERFQCWILLMLNCGMTQTDLNDLKRDEVDLKAGRIIRARTKTSNHDKPPVVNRKLWNITLEHLKREMQKCTDEEYALQATKGARLITEKDENKISRYDLVSRNWTDIRTEAGFAGKQLKWLRKTGSTTLKKDKFYMFLDQLYLGHAKPNVADKHYNYIEGDVYKPLDEATAYLGKQFGLK